ncbi:MAG: M56 family metallopeptidase [Pirellulales bacterium]
MLPLEFLSEPFSQRLAMTLVHFLWQGLAVAGVFLAAIHLFGVRRPQVRYVLSLVALVAMLACPVATLAIQCLRPAAGSTLSTAATRPRVESSPAARGGALPAPAETWGPFDPAPSGDTILSEERPAEQSSAAWSSALAGWLRAAQPGVVAVWALGVIVLSVRMFLGLLTIAALKRRGQAVAPQVGECVGRLCRRLGLVGIPRVLASVHVQEATAVGFFRPLVLLPAAWLAQLPPEVLEAVIAHELAHIRRWDLWANLFQRMVEVLLFYHPAVWWLSRRVRTERELCCDELAVTATGERVVYATALELVARRRLARVRPALGAGISIGDRKMALLNRVRHVLGRVPSQRFAGWWPAGLLGLAVLAGAWVAGSNWTTAVGAEDGDRAVKRDGDRPAAREGERREGDRERADRPAAREGERREGERREGERREGERERPDRPAAREGERREGDRIVAGGFVLEGTKFEAIGGQDLGRLVQTINELREQVAQLRREVEELRAVTGRERVQPPREGQPGPVARERMENVRRRIAELRGAGKVEEAERLTREAQGAMAREQLNAMDLHGPRQERQPVTGAMAREQLNAMDLHGPRQERQPVTGAMAREQLNAMDRRVDELRQAGRMDEAEMVLRELKLNQARARIGELRAAGKADEAARLENELRQGMIRERLGAMERRVRELKEAGKMDAAEQAARELKAAEVMLRIEELRRAGKPDQAEQLEKEARELLPKKEGGENPARARLEAMERRVDELRKAGKMDAAEQAMHELKLAAAKVRAVELRAAGKVEEAEKLESEIKKALQKEGGQKPAQARLEAMERRVDELRKAGKMDAAEQAMRELKLAAAKVRAVELRAAGKVEEAEKLESEIKKALQKEGDRPAPKEAKEFEKVKADLEKKKAEAEKARAEGEKAEAKEKAVNKEQAEKKERAEKEKAQAREKEEAANKEKAEAKERGEKEKAEAKEKAEKKEKEDGDKDKAEAKEKSEKKEGDKDKGEKEEGEKEKGDKR